jgi:hypothetical protein
MPDLSHLAGRVPAQLADPGQAVEGDADQWGRLTSTQAAHLDTAAAAYVAAIADGDPATATAIIREARYGLTDAADVQRNESGNGNHPGPLDPWRLLERVVALALATPARKGR